jgi:hypothetical protein
MNKKDYNVGACSSYTHTQREREREKEKERWGERRDDEMLIWE